jgi:carbon monoxide dehydrogenase subunit G
MASVSKEIRIAAAPEHVWAHLRDFQAVDKRVAPGFVVESAPDGVDARRVKFANGTEAREILVDADDAKRRLVYAVVGSERVRHHNASVQILPDGNAHSRLVWTADFVPHEIRPYIEEQMSEAASIMSRALAK